MIYLDNAATTKVDEKAIENLIKFNSELYFNNSAIYGVASELNNNVNVVRKKILDFTKASPQSKLIFTSGATESNNLAIIGTKVNKDLIYLFGEGEHPSVYNVAKELELRGKSVKFIPLSENGEVNYAVLEDMLNEKIGFVSVMHVSNETGAINDIEKIGNLIKLKSPNAIFHVDAVQSFCKIPLNLSECNIDLCTISGHKIYAPKGIGALIKNNRVSLKSIVFGGGQEFGFRSGTENIAQIMALNSVIKVNEIEHIQSLKKCFLLNLQPIMHSIKINGNGSPYILSISISGIRGETLVHMLEKKGIIISTGSACSSSKIGNRVLASIGRNKEEILGSVRISFGKFNTLSEVEIAAKTFMEELGKLLALNKRKN